jgi:hypothetical protein
MGVASSPFVPARLLPSLVALAVLCTSPCAAAPTNAATPEANRRKPLQRCDQLKGQSEVECLNKARERVIEARKKREGQTSAGANGDHQKK